MVTAAEDRLTRQQAAVVTARDERRGSPQLIIVALPITDGCELRDRVGGLHAGYPVSWAL